MTIWVYGAAFFSTITSRYLGSALLLCAMLVAGFPSRASAETLLGVYYGEGGWAMSDVHNMELWQGRRYAVVELFADFCDSPMVMYNLFHRALLNIWENHNVPAITWRPTICGSTTPYYIDQMIANGDYDAYINAWADGLKSFLSGPDGVFGTADDRRVYLRFAHEMNGTWYPWSATGSGQDPLQYIAMWRHVHSIFESKGLGSSHVQWVWCVGSKDSGTKYTAEQYYPGDAYVDWLGIDAYNFANRTYAQTTFQWKTPEEILDNMVGRLRHLSAKPIALMETASSAYYAGVVVSAKNDWIPTIYSYVRSNGIKMVIWFNHDSPLSGKSCCQVADWAVFGGEYGDGTFTVSGKTYNTYGYYPTAVKIWWLAATNPTNPRLLTDAQFAGHL